MRRLNLLVAIVMVLFALSCSKDDSGTEVRPTQGASTEELKNGNNNCTPDVYHYDETFVIPDPLPWTFNIYCIDEPVQLQYLSAHYWGKGNVAASCHVNDKGKWEETAIFLGVNSGHTYTSYLLQNYHNNYNWWWNGAFWEEQGAIVFHSTSTGSITNNVTNETFPVSISSRFVYTPSGQVALDSYELSCE